MRHIRRIIVLHVRSGLSVRLIARALSVPPSTVADYIRRYSTSNLDLADIADMSDAQVYAALFPEQGKGRLSGKPLPDFSLIHRELRRKHVTRLLLWEEYRAQHPEGYGYTQFCELYRQWSRKVSVSMRMLELRLYRVKHFKAILSNKVYDIADTATVLVPDSHHENVRGQAYYQ